VFTHRSYLMELSRVLIGLAHSAPALIVFLVAGIVGMINLNRYKTPALLVMLGGLVGGLTLFGSVTVRELMWANAQKEGNIEAVATLTSVIGIAGNVIVAVGISMFVFAVFVGRKPGARTDDRDYDDRPRRDRRDPRSDSREPE